MNNFKIIFTVLTIAGFAFCNGKVVSLDDALGKESNHDVPYQALVMVYKDDVDPANSTFCSAILVNEKWILTTSTCGIKRNSKVILGSDKWCVARKKGTTFQYDDGKEFRSVKRIVEHPDMANEERSEEVKKGNEEEEEEEEYVGFIMAELKTKVTLSQNIKLAKLATTQPQTHETYDVSGWGIKSYDCEATGSCKLRIAPHQVMTKKECEEAWGGATQLYDDEFCAGSLASASSPCSVHEGSPLVKDGQVYGLAVYVYSYCSGTPELPSVYFPVASIKDWIESTIKMK